MKKLRRKGMLGAATAAALLGGIGGASADGGIKIGTLSCDVEGGMGFIIGSSKGVACTFTSAGGGPPEYYTGVINKLGFDVGFTGATVMGWVVFAPGRVNPGALAGTYVGASMEATAAVGAGAHALIGGFNRSVTLQPFSLQAQTGLNLAAAVAHLELRLGH